MRYRIIMSSPFPWGIIAQVNVLEKFFQTSHFVSNHVIVRMLKLLTVWNLIYNFKRNRLLNRIKWLIYVYPAYWDNVYFSYLPCRKQHKLEVSLLPLNNSDAYFVRPIYNSIHTHVDIIKYAYRGKPDIRYYFIV